MSLSETDLKVSRALDLYSDMVWRICFMYMKNKYDAEDAYQDVFLKYVRQLGRFKSEEHEKAWLCTVAFNRCKDMLKRAHRKNVSLEEAQEPSVPFRDGSNPVLEAVMDLPEKYKESVYLHYYEGYTSAQIGKILGCKENTVYSLLSRGRQMLKERLGDDFED